MNRWFTIVCILGIFSGTVHSAYWTLTAGGNVLQSIAVSLKTISTTLATYNTALNNARTQIYNAAVGLLNSMNSTYSALNKTYSVLDPTYNSTIMSIISTLNPQMDMVKQMDLSMVSYIQQQISTMQDKVSRVMRSLLQNMLVSSAPFTANGERCALANATQLVAANVSLSRYGSCLDNQTAIISTIAPIAANLLSYGLVDYNLLTQQISLCTTAGSNLCTATYIASLTSELSAITSEIYFAGNYLTQIANILVRWISYCGQLTELDIFEIFTRIQTQIVNCQNLN
ncbi:uncharacterized protein LOC129731877 [Wyeomyia smithii]|uniref:uncharacterized protein LOC129731877 n=1 Tax=Wyeomyia smithii TaxID=174621 RepID=UPI002467DE37|nr:uncharacterized protein LOC129731877 [Wyeomyia smithii]